MSQYIDRSNLLNAIARERRRCRRSSPRRDFTAADCQRLIEAQPPVLSWISVKDRLPPPMAEVLCAFDDGEIRTYWQNWAASVEPDPFFYRDWDHNKHVTHWMPLPQAPEEEAHGA